ncbi:ABC transporter substrate-binding protein [Bradyrhizobium sp. U87765 SZCCT0131]|uniref:ABC transporter substrate-binding protein n=1 Tax=unclassified Bradyrhizobium TaxID=2631580 RepID=UPI001BAC2CA1|nr:MULTISPECIES: ABC transporter substrate-binding protein [unclassified Bradyrhizobium]MBR1217870.1 ABC transporter substrate-binding protein [Bradyrhizobium sp. U87765 SZCCT0131]MBR1261184.1 ABC transporter substrate-binding protein [Bradyrhizobium sp. U87765 SZCCT0134]MBR1303368.1 ABC transporter substrate-binding protein [Bradyrhizobium sp. U87765 SZCCT0110]MBR1318974.1 ABC transporter substrate-binding protein [Bradyrhizobium sp. U87765 SZCCT0109]MBR1347299.1 ABC transporter substrate-bin
MKKSNEGGLTRRGLLGSGVGAAVGLMSWPGGAAIPGKVRVGAINPSSGVLAFPGQACVRGIDVGARFAREKFGIDMEIIHADTQSRPENGRIAAENLIRQGCTVLIGAWDSGATISALQAAEAAQVPMVVHVASATQVTSQGFTQVFRYCPTSLTIVRKSLTELKSLLSSVKDAPTSAVVMHLNNTMGQSTAASIDQAWKEVDVPLNIVQSIPYDEKAKDLSVEVAKAKASGADALVSVTRVNDAVMIIRECVKQGWNPRLVFSPNSNGVQDKAYYDALGKYGDGAILSTLWYNPKAPDAATILRRFATDYPNDWVDGNSGCAFEAVQIVADAVSRAGSPESLAVHAALKATDMMPILMSSGRIRFDATGQNTGSDVTILQGQNGRPRVVAPQVVAEASLQYPLVPFNAR